MKMLSHAVAAALAFGATVALAQSGAVTSPSPSSTTAPPGQTLSQANVPTATPDSVSQGARAAGANPHDVPQLTFVQEPTASAAKLDGPDAELVKSIVDSLNAEPSLKNTKITVQTEQDTGNVILTGATMTPEQVKKAGEIVTAQAGAGKVVNAILSDWHPSQALPAPTAQVTVAEAPSQG